MPTQTTPELSSAAPATPAPPAKMGWQLPRLQEAGLLVVIVIIGTVLTLVAPTIRGENGFLRASNLIPSVFTTMSWYAIMAVGVTVVIITGGIDISVGSIMGLAALGTAAVLQKFPPNASPWVAIPLGVGVPLGIGLLCGLINGALVVGLDMHPFIVTLGTLSIFRGIAVNAVPEGSLPYGDKVLPQAFTDHFIAYTMNWQQAEPAPMLIMLAVMLMGWVYLQFMIGGRETYAIGGNEEAARFSGIRVGAVKLRSYVLCGACAGIAGMVNCGFYKSAATITGYGYELDVIAAAVVGGASLSGGRGTALGAVLGTLVITLITDGISLLANYEYKVGSWSLTVRQEWKMIIVGASIIIAVAVDRLSDRLRDRRLARVAGRR
jgi:ribose/xylose/arabinose/galactoside ABC-type transport system permease subunit